MVTLERCEKSARATIWRWSWLISALTPVLIRLALIPWLGIPILRVEDEFVHMLIAETFGHIRLANPRHPFSEHFEAAYVLQHPSYSGIYAPGWGAFLALGNAMGHPFVAVCLSGALMGLSLYWAARALLNRQWALVASLIGTLKCCALTYWMDSYLGGPLTAAAGALTAGSLLRFCHTPRPRWIGCAALGWSVQFTIRPFESVIFLAVWTVVTLVYFRHAISMRWLACNIVLPASPAILAISGFTFAYNRSVTGGALLHPYVLSQQLYGVPQGFIIEPVVPRPPTQTPVHVSMYDGQTASRRPYSSIDGFFFLSFIKLKLMFLFYIGFGITACLAFISIVLNSRVYIVLLALFATTAIIELLYWFWTPHYLAASLALVAIPSAYAVSAMASTEQLSRWKRLVLLSFVGGLFVLDLIPLANGVIANKPTPSQILYGHRDRIKRFLERQPGLHLVLFDDRPMVERYSPWIYNGADIDGSKVVWARSLTPDKDQRLRSYFRDRQVWTIEFRKDRPHLIRAR